jgi:AraC-like DNA-binding protein
VTIARGDRDATVRGTATIRASILTPIVRELDLLADDVDALLARHGLFRAQLRDPYAAVSLHRYVAFLEAAASRVGDPGFGMRVGTLLRPPDLGPAGLLFATAPTMRKGLQRFGRYLATIQGATQADLRGAGDAEGWVYRIEDATIWPRAQDCELTLSTMCSLIRARLGQRWAPVEVHFEHGGVRRDPALRDVFRAPVRFNQPMTQLLIPTADLDRPLRTEDADVAPALERHAQDLLARDMHARGGSAGSVTERVDRLVGAQIGMERITVASVARDLGLSARSLQRRLAEEGTTLRDLVQAHRRLMAESRLTSGQASHALIAHALGYSDSTVFWRAFKRWSGASPTDYRGRAGQGPREG